MRPTEVKPDAVLLPPPLLFLCALVVGAAAATLCGSAFVPGGISAILGVCIGVASLILIVWSVRLFRRAGTSFLPASVASTMVVRGPYRYSRNPMYLGMVGGLMGLSFIMQSVVFGLFSVVFFMVSVHYGVILREEKYLTLRFGEPYRDYMRRVRRWL